MAGSPRSDAGHLLPAAMMTTTATQTDDCSLDDDDDDELDLGSDELVDRYPPLSSGIASSTCHQHAFYDRLYARRLSFSGVTTNSGDPGQISKSSPPSPFPTLSAPSAPSLPLLLHVLPFPPLPPPYSYPFPSPSLPPLPLVGLGSAIAPQRVRAEPGRQTHFFCNSQPTVCNLVKSFITHMHKTRIHSLS